jgi:hypothetical protein
MTTTLDLDELLDRMRGYRDDCNYAAATYLAIETFPAMIAAAREAERLREEKAKSAGWQVFDENAKLKVLYELRGKDLAERTTRAEAAEARIKVLEAEVCEQAADINRLREKLAAAYAGDARHASDCATSNAPAEEPGPCNCGALAALSPAAEAQDTAQTAAAWRRWGAPDVLATDGAEYWCMDAHGDVYRGLAVVHDAESVGFLICTPDGGEEEIAPKWIMPLAAFPFPQPADARPAQDCDCTSADFYTRMTCEQHGLQASDLTAAQDKPETVCRCDSCAHQFVKCGPSGPGFCRDHEHWTPKAAPAGRTPAMTDRYDEIIKRLREAKGPSKTLDADIAEATGTVPPRYYRNVGYCDGSFGHDERSGICWIAKDYTASIDAALALVEKLLPGWHWTVTSDKREGVAGAWIWLERRFPEDTAEDIPMLRNYEAEAPTAPLAILIALFTALQSKEAGND